MKTICQCPTCKAIKFIVVETEEEVWRPLTPSEFMAFEIMQSSETLQIIVENIYASPYLCPICHKQTLN